MMLFEAPISASFFRHVEGRKCCAMRDCRAEEVVVVVVCERGVEGLVHYLSGKRGVKQLSLALPYPAILIPCLCVVWVGVCETRRKGVAGGE